jgi:hypothetical protein
MKRASCTYTYGCETIYTTRLPIDETHRSRAFRVREPRGVHAIQSLPRFGPPNWSLRLPSRRFNDLTKRLYSFVPFPCGVRKQSYDATYYFR